MQNTPWTSNMLFKRLDDKQLKVIEPYVYKLSYGSNDMVMNEGENGLFAFLIGEGSVSVYKNELKLTDIQSGNLVGLMALIDGNLRSANVIAGSDGARGYGISKDGWNQIINNGDSKIESILLSNYLKYQQDTVRNTNVLGLTEARGRIEEEKKRVMSAHFFTQMVLGMVIFTFVLGYLSDLADRTESTYVSFVLLAAYSIWSFYYVRHSGISFASFGLDLKNFKPAMILNLKATSIFILLLFIVKYILINFLPDQFGDQLIDFYTFKDGSIISVFFLIFLYSIHAIFQEFIARACIQGGLMQFISGKWADWKAIILATLMFSSFHIMIDVTYAFLTIIPGLFWGYLFAKEKNLLAVSISHILIGIVAIFILNVI